MACKARTIPHSHPHTLTHSHNLLHTFTHWRIRPLTVHKPSCDLSSFPLWKEIMMPVPQLKGVINAWHSRECRKSKHRKGCPHPLAPPPLPTNVHNLVRMAQAWINPRSALKCGQEIVSSISCYEECPFEELRGIKPSTTLSSDQIYSPDKLMDVLPLPSSKPFHRRDGTGKVEKKMSESHLTGTDMCDFKCNAKP